MGRLGIFMVQPIFDGFLSALACVWYIYIHVGTLLEEDEPPPKNRMEEKTMKSKRN